MNKVTKTWMGKYSSVVEYRILKNQHSRKSQADKNIEVLVLLASFIVLGFSIVPRRKHLLSIVQFNK